ncbi:MAG TPA: response regulator, partial [Streptosporangiaceae bacterium]
MTSHQGAAQAIRTGPRLTGPRLTGPIPAHPPLAHPPLAAGTEPPARDVHGAEGVRGGEGARRILVVDDEPNIRSFIGRALTAAGYLIGFAGSGSEGLRHALDEHYDLVILDLVMP